MGYSHSAVDFDNDIRRDRDISDLRFEGTYYFGDVDPSDSPKAVAAFVARQSSVSLSGSDGEFDFDNFKLDQRSYGVSGRHHIDDSGWLLGASHRQSVLESTVDIEFTSTSAHLGKYIQQHTRLTAFLETRETDNGFSAEDDNQVYLELRHLQPLDSAKFYNAEIGLGYTDADDGDDAIELSLAATYFAILDLGVSASYSQSFGEFTDISNFTLGAEWFMSDWFSIDFSYRYRQFDNKGGLLGIEGEVVDAGFNGIPDGDSNRYALTIKIRL